jgi:hypothetical protein
MSRSLSPGLALLSMLVAGSLAAQEMAPPPFLQIFREEVRVGRAAQHPMTEAGWPRAFARAKVGANYLALTTIYGPAEAWFMEGHASVAEIEANNRAIDAAPGLQAELDRLSQADAANVSSSRTILAHFLPEASNAGRGSEAAAARAWEVTIFRVRPGKEASFFGGAKLYQSLVQKAGASAPWAAYEVLAGMPGPTYLVLSPHASLSDIDPTTGAGAAIQKVMTEETMKSFGTLGEGFISVETIVFAPSPEMSYLSADWISQDPKFWGKKATAVRPGQ